MEDRHCRHDGHLIEPQRGQWPQPMMNDECGMMNQDLV
jgi:hypothetical protein